MPSDAGTPEPGAMAATALETTAPQPLRLKGQPLASARDVAEYFDEDYGRLLWTLYKADETVRYRHFEIPKRTGGMRPIHSPQGLVRDLQTRLKADFEKLYVAHPNAHGFITTRSVVTNAHAHTSRRWVFNVDLENFFPTINFGRIRGLLMRPPFDMGPAAAAVIAQIVTHQNGLPQGAPTSPVLSNFIAVSLDRAMLRLARQQHVAYSRYADDITFSSSDAVFPPALAEHEEVSPGVYRTKAGEALQAAVEASGFRINARKVRLQGRGVRQSVTGISVNAKVNVARERIRRLRAMLHAWERFGLAAAAREHDEKYRHGGRRPGADVERSFRNIVYGNLSFVKMVRGQGDPVFLKLCGKLLDLDPNPSRFLRRMVYGAADYDVFISHATEDKPEIARPIYAACQKLGIKAFLDEEHIGWGENFTRTINSALGAARTVLIVVSSNSVSKDWPLAEINTALAFEIEGKKRVLALVVGKPDLSKLPLIKTKNYMSWDGDGTKVAQRLKTLVTRDEGSSAAAKTADPAEEPSEANVADLIWPKTASKDTATAHSAESSPAAETNRSTGWLGRLLGRRA